MQQSQEQLELVSRRDRLQEAFKGIQAEQASLQKMKESNQMIYQRQEVLLNNFIADSEDDQITLELKRNIKGCLGSLGSMIAPTSSQYEVAVKLALGPAMNYVLVENQEAAKDINEYLKNRGASREVLILCNMQARLDYELHTYRNEIRGLKGVKLIFDTIKEIPNEQIRNCVRHFVLKKVYVDSAKLGFQVRGKLSGRFKQIITGDGTVISTQGGVIKSHGNTDLLKQKKFGDPNRRKELEQQLLLLREKLELNERQMQQIKTANPERELRDVSDQLQNLEHLQQLTKQEFEDIQKSVESYAQRCAQVRERSEENLHVLERLRASLASNNERLKALRGEVAQLDAVVFRDFCQRTGISCVAELKRENINYLEYRYKQKEQLSYELSRLRLELSQAREQQEKSASDLRKFEEMTSRTAQQMEFLQKQKVEAASSKGELEAKIGEMKVALERSEEDLKQFEQQNREDIESYRNWRKECLLQEREEKNLKHEISRLVQQKLGLLEDCRMKNWEIPVAASSSQFEEQLLSQLEQGALKDHLDSAALVHINYGDLHAYVLDTEKIDLKKADLSEDDILKLKRRMMEVLDDKNDKFEEFTSKEISEGLVGNQDQLLENESHIKGLSAELDALVKE